MLCSTKTKTKTNVQRQMTLKVHIFESFIGDVYGDVSSPAVGERFFLWARLFQQRRVLVKCVWGTLPSLSLYSLASTYRLPFLPLVAISFHCAFNKAVRGWWKSPAGQRAQLLPQLHFEVFMVGKMHLVATCFRNVSALQTVCWLLHFFAYRHPSYQLPSPTICGYFYTAHFGNCT